MEKINRGTFWGWYGGIIGGSIFLPMLSFLFIHTGHYMLSLWCMAGFLLTAIYAMRVTPWKYPDTSYGKLIIPVVSIPVITAIAIAVVKPEYKGQTVNIWQVLTWIPLFMTPVLTTWKVTYKKNQHKT
ncbi:membrane hypothetical protein [Desulfamplus magnetovallimortis]|uniref:Uncharacterized protein n=2 Tax=Desulfamplus magnetovallimortis TaxID=1246637 RepID=A0A1W1HFW8_9BACT|nr:membrane hypothetical protein [Desulfamplus magnetovallimortis]